MAGVACTLYTEGSDERQSETGQAFPKQTARKAACVALTAPLLGAYASGWADTRRRHTKSNRTDLQRAILPTAPAGIMQDITPLNR